MEDNIVRNYLFHVRELLRDPELISRYGSYKMDTSTFERIGPGHVTGIFRDKYGRGMLVTLTPNATFSYRLLTNSIVNIIRHAKSYKFLP